MSDPYVNLTLGNYKILRLLGQGAMGWVYLARDMTLGREVALKIMRPRYANQPEFRRLFLQEARLAGKLEHPGIVTIHHFGDSDTLYIVMEYIAGGNLFELLSQWRGKQHWIPLHEAVEVVRQIALALDYAHKKDVLHRDIKPANILLKPVSDSASLLNYQPVLADLGLAKLAGTAGEATGTPAYMSPEQAMGDRVDARSDIYSLGILLYELTTGKVPFSIETLEDAKLYHTQKRPPAPSSLREKLPKQLEEIILQALAKQPDRRFATAGALAKALGALSTPELQNSVPPASQGSVVSMATKIQQSMAPRPAHDLLDKFGTFHPPIPGAAYLQIMTPDGKLNAVPITSRSFSVGRSSRNDLIIDDDRASREHARIEYDGRVFRISDLDSSNGTYLDGVKLLASVPQEWPTDRPLRIGRHHFRLIPGTIGGAQDGARGDNQAGAPVPPVSMHPDGTQAIQDSKPSPLGVASIADIHLNVEPPEIAVSPGGDALLNVEIRNDSEEVVQYQIRTVGVPLEWVTIRPSEVELLPGHRKSAQILLRLPQSTSTKAGRYRVEIEAVGKAGAPTPLLRAKTRLNISAFGQFTSELRQNKASVRTPLTLSVINNRNKAERFTIACWDEANELEFAVAHNEIEVPPGKTGYFQFTGQPLRRKWIGGAKQHAFQVKVTSQSGQIETHRGTFTSRGLIPPWVPPVVLTVALAAAGAGLGFYRYQQSQIATATAVAIANATATSTTELATARALATNEAGTATEVADATGTAEAIARATATWLPQDDDRDGLSNEYEIGNELLPGNRDTDEDGLHDGDEVNVYFTKPLTPDSDNDGWLDGFEVGEGSDPLNEDTDGDTILDNVDPDPLNPPTPTPTPTNTPNLDATAAFIAKMTADVLTREAAAMYATMTREFIATSTQEAKDAEAAANQATRDAQATADERAARDAQTASAMQASASETAQQQARDGTGTAEARAAATSAAATASVKRLTFSTLDSFCRTYGYDDGAYDSERGANGWGCVLDGDIDFLGEGDFDALCREEFGNDNLDAQVTDPQVATGWICIE